MNSYWIETTKNLEIKNKINDNYTADVCIVGAGICGLTTRILFSKKRFKSNNSR